MGPTWPENRSPGALESALGSKLASRAVWGPFSAFFSLGKPCRNAWQEVRVACFECICLCSFDRCQKTLLPLRSLFFCSFSGLLSSWICASGYPLFRLLCRTVQSGPEVKPTRAQVGPKIGPSWAQVGPKLGLSWAQVGPSWRKLAPTWLIWAPVALKFALAASPGWPASPRTSEDSETPYAFIV